MNKQNDMVLVRRSWIQNWDCVNDGDAASLPAHVCNGPALQKTLHDLVTKFFKWRDNTNALVDFRELEGAMVAAQKHLPKPCPHRWGTPFESWDGKIKSLCQECHSVGIVHLEDAPITPETR